MGAAKGMAKRTKIVCTMGPACDDEAILREMILSGMNVARFNFSHGSHEEHHERMARVRRVAAELGMPVAILLDTKGPEVRTGLLKDHKPVTLVSGSEVVVAAEETSEKNEGTAERFTLDYLNLPSEVEVGSSILVDDGLIELEVVSVAGQEMTCKVLNGGELGERKGINLPNVNVGLPALTEQDKADILFGIEEDIDFIAASFIRDAQAVRTIRELCLEHGADHISIMPKIESAQGVANFDEILEESDGVMVARGDLGVEVPAEHVPHIQKKIIRKCNEAYKPVITATQMLDSMIRNPRPTRAEVTDVANAIYDGTDAIMLSGETAAGKYPVEAVKMQASIAEQTEKYLDSTVDLASGAISGVAAINQSVGMAAVTTAMNVGAKAILIPTQTGRSARLVSHFRPNLPIFAVSRNEWAVRKMCMCWGVEPWIGTETGDVHFVITNAIDEAKKHGVVNTGDITVVTAGDPSTSITLSDQITSTNVVYVAQVR